MKTLPPLSQPSDNTLCALVPVLLQDEPFDPHNGHHGRSAIANGDVLLSAEPTRVLDSVRSQDHSVLEVAMYTFGDLDTAEAWMQQPHEHLGGSPERVCQRSSEGRRSVVCLLHAIAAGTEP